MREPALARLDFVPRTGPHHDVKRDQILMLGGHRHHVQPVRQRIDRPRIRKKFRDAIRLRECRLRQQ